MIPIPGSHPDGSIWLYVLYYMMMDAGIRLL